MFLRKSLFGILGMVLAGGLVAFAQEPQPQSPSIQDDAFRKGRIERRQRHRERIGRGDRMPGGDGLIGRRHGIGHLTQELNLSEEQRQQSRAIMERRVENLKAQREELFRLREKRLAGTFSAEDGARAQALHQEIRTAMEAARNEMTALLTAEQRARLEQLKTERKEKRELRMKERQERLNRRLQ